MCIRDRAMAITLVSGSSVNFPLPFNSVRFLTTAIVAEMGYASGLHRELQRSGLHHRYTDEWKNL